MKAAKRTASDAEQVASRRLARWSVENASSEITRIGLERRQSLSVDKVVLEQCRQRKSMYVRHPTARKLVSYDPPTQLNQRQRLRCNTTMTHR